MDVIRDECFNTEYDTGILKATHQNGIHETRTQDWRLSMDATYTEIAEEIFTMLVINTVLLGVLLGSVLFILYYLYQRRVPGPLEDELSIDGLLSKILEANSRLIEAAQSCDRHIDELKQTNNGILAVTQASNGRLNETLDDIKQINKYTHQATTNILAAAQVGNRALDNFQQTSNEILAAAQAGNSSLDDIKQANSGIQQTSNEILAAAQAGNSGLDDIKQANSGIQQTSNEILAAAQAGNSGLDDIKQANSGIQQTNNEILAVAQAGNSSLGEIKSISDGIAASLGPESTDEVMKGGPGQYR